MSTYKEIVKTTGVIAFVKIFTIAFGVIRAKAIALMVGASGFGYYSIFIGFSEFFSTISTLGIDQSGVREIAKSHNANDLKKLSDTRNAIKQTTFFLAIFFCIIAIYYSKIISELLFGNGNFYEGIIIVSCGVVFSSIARGQMAVLNGLRLIKQLAYCQILGAIAGSISAVIFIYYIGENGIPIAITLVSVTLFLCTFYYERKIYFIKCKLFGSNYYHEVKKLLSLGVSLGLSGIMSAIVANFSMIFIREELGIDVVGLYQASWTISNLYIGTILGAMGVDFLPRLMSIIDNKNLIILMVNEQIEMGVLLGSAGILFTFMFAPTILHIFYSSDFINAGNIMRWHSFGILLRVVAWPLSFIITAKGRGWIYVGVQAVFHLLEYSLLVIFVKLYGQGGLGVNYLVAYSCYFILVYLASRHLVEFKFNQLTKLLTFISFLFLLLGVFSIIFLQNTNELIAGAFLVCINLVWVCYILKHKMEIDVLSIIKLKFRKI